MDAVCNRGLTFVFYTQNHPAPKKYLDMRISPMHYIVYAMFDTFKDEYHEVNFDNLYSSANFSFAAYVKQNKKVNTQGVCWGRCGIPPHVTQVEENDKKKAEEVRWVIFDYLF